MRILCRIGLLCAMLLFPLGCGARGPSLTPAEGVIKIDGRPAANLLIQFSSTTMGGKGASATAVSDSSGRFVLATDDGQPGVSAGTHKVTVVDNNLNVEEDHPMSGKQPKIVPSRIPSGYASVTTTPLEVTVAPGKKEYPLELSSR